MSFFKQDIRVCIELGDASIKVISTKQKKLKTEVLFYEHVNLLEAYSLTSVMDLSDEHFIEQLEHLKKKYNIKNRSISLVIPSTDTILHSFKIDSTLSNWEINDVIQTEIEQVATNALNEMRIICHNQDFETESNMQSIIACGISNDEIDRYLSIFNRAGLKLAMITVDALELYNAYLKFENPAPQEPETIIFSGDKHWICLILRPNNLPFIHTINLNSDELEDLLQITKVTIPAKNKDLEHSKTPAEQEIDSSRNEKGKGRKKKIKTYPVIEKVFSEIQKCQNHISTVEGLEFLGEIKFTGTLAKEPELAEVLNNKFNKKVKLWNPFDALLKETDENSVGVRFAATLGASIRVD